MEHRLGMPRRGQVINFAGCCTVLKRNIQYPEHTPVTRDDDVRWSRALYVWADVRNAYGLTIRMGLLLPLKLLDDMLWLSHEVQRPWEAEDEEGYRHINRELLLAALNRRQYEVLWQCDDMNGRVIYYYSI